MSYFQKHLKTISNENIPARTSKSRKDQPKNHHPREDSRVQQQRPKEKPMQFATQGSHVVQSQAMNQRGHGQGESMMSRQLQTLMMEADNSMEQLLNSSINQFTRYLQDKDNLVQQHHQLIEQNHCLRASLDQLKNILKSKLESALQKQKEELTVMMEDYIKLITKLLKDKQELTVSLEQLEDRAKEAERKSIAWEKQAREGRARVEELAREKDAHIGKTKKQIDEFLQIIDQYEEQADHEGRQNEHMRARIQELQAQLAHTQSQLKEAEAMRQEGSSQLSVSSLQEKISTQSNKIQTLLELLQRAQEDNRVLRDSLHKISQSDDKLSQLEAEYRDRLQELQRQHEQQFMEYQKAVRQTISKKDECIERLTGIIDGYRSKRGLESSMETTGR